MQTSLSAVEPELRGRVAVVTGASRGIGYHLSRHLAAAGAHVIALARDVVLLDRLRKDIRESGGTAETVSIDLAADPNEIDALVKMIAERHRRLDILVANAGVLGPRASMSPVSSREFDDVMDVNVKSVWKLMCGFDELLRASDAGRAIIVSSAGAHYASEEFGLYSASKAAVEALARSWSVAAEGTNLRINIVNPGGTRTAMRAAFKPEEDPAVVPDAFQVAEKISRLASPALDENGKIFDVRMNRFLSHRPPD